MIAADAWERLRAEGLIEGERPQAAEAAQLWYVRAMLGIAGWIGAAFLIAFVGASLAFVLEDGMYAAAAGAACCGGAWLLFRAFDGQDFAEQFALAVSLAGQVMLMIGFADALDPGRAPFYVATALLQGVLAAAVPNFLHRVLTAAGAGIALSLAVAEMSLHVLAAPFLCAGAAFIWLYPKRWARGGSVWRPLGYGLVVALLLVETFRLLGAEWLLGREDRTEEWMALHGPAIGRALSAAILVWTAAALARQQDHAPKGRTTLFAAGGALLIGLLSLDAPGLASALLILLLGFGAGSRILLALGIFSLLGFVSHFYYSLHATLLEKSGLLALSGLLLLGAHLLLRRPTSAPEASTDA